MTIKNKRLLNIETDSVGWDISNWRRSFSYWDNYLPKDLTGLKALELGCAYNGGISLWLAEKGAEVTCSGFDINLQDVSDRTKAIHKKYNVHDRINYANIDGTKLDALEQFDIIAFKSTLGGAARDNEIQKASMMIDNIYKALKPGGCLIFSENIQATKVHQAINNKFGNGAKGWKYFSIPELQKLTTNFSSFNYKAIGFISCFGRREWQKRLLSKFDLLADGSIPEEWHYILTAVAKK